MRTISIYKLRITLLVWIIFGCHAFAEETFTENGFTYRILSDNTSVSLTCYSPTQNTDFSHPLHILASVIHEGKRYKVQQIGPSAFCGLTEIQSVIIDEGIEAIHKYAFEYCTNLHSISIPSSVESVGEGLFGSCYNLTSIVVDANNEYLDSRDNSNAIIDSDNDELLVACSSTVIPSSVRSIGTFAFYHCNTMEHLIIPEGVKKLDNLAFFGCSSLRSITLPETLTELGADVFIGCNSLESIFIPKNVNKIAVGNIFNSCNSLTVVEVDKANPFYDSRSNCNGIVRKSDSALIATCGATTITNDICVLDDDCFAGTIIHVLNIPMSVTKISESAFEGCYEIDIITIAEGNPIYIAPIGSNAILSKDGKVLILGCRNTVIPDGVETIANNAFTGRYSKLIFRVPQSVKQIGAFAFSNCNALCEVIIPQSVETVGVYAFRGCVNLAIAQIQSKGNKIEANVFSNCYSLKAVSLPNGLEEISQHAFKSCKSLKHIRIPSSVTKIDNTAFQDCDMLDKE